ncbi:MAG TPA: universal stress protein [Aestuariivirgaceae bacterium]|jgi:nucleotide-binding universal stress UspA family protein
MPYKTIIVTLNELKAIESVLNVSVDLATTFEAHLTGLYVIPGPALYPAMGPYASPEMIDVVTGHFEERSKEIRNKVELMVKPAGIPFEWRELRSVDPDISSTVSEESRTADLIVLSEPDPNSSMGVERDFVVNVVIDSGRPVLILPHTGRPQLKLEQIICGYNGSRESARAIHDALPLLKLASDVRVVWVDPSKTPHSAGTLPGADMAVSLSRHGVHATAEAMPTSGEDAGEALFTRAQDIGASLIVMGAYGHSRLREYIFGGATRSALSQMRVPLLMSH